MLQIATLRLAHLTDPHLTQLGNPSIHALLNKRVLGYLSWRRKRRHIHKRHVLDRLKTDLDRMAPDHIAITGDLVQISLPQEFEDAERWLREIGQPDALTVVPGNHDAYVRIPWPDSIGRWASFMTSDLPGLPADRSDFSDFPFVRVRGEVAIVGLSSARPTPPLLASGSLGRVQLETLRTILDRLRQQGLFRLLLVHHPPIIGTTRWRKRLTDASEFVRVVAASGAELILHGHDHTFQTNTIASRFGSVPVVGIPSASALAYKAKPVAHYQILTITGGNDRWHVKVEIRGYDTQSDAFVWRSGHDFERRREAA